MVDCKQSDLAKNLRMQITWIYIGQKLRIFCWSNRVKSVHGFSWFRLESVLRTLLAVTIFRKHILTLFEILYDSLNLSEPIFYSVIFTHGMKESVATNFKIRQCKMIAIFQISFFHREKIKNFLSLFCIWRIKTYLIYIY